MRKKILVQNRKVPHWANMLREEIGEGAVRKAAHLAQITLAGVFDGESKIDVHSEARFIQACADLTGNSLFAAEAAMNGQYTLQVAGFVLKYSRNLREGLTSGAKLIPAVDPSTALTLNEGATQSTLQMTCSDGFLMNQFQYREFYVFGVISMLREVTGANVMPLEVRFQHSRGEDGRDLRKLLGFPIEFGCDTTEIILKTSALDLPILSCDETLLAFLLEQGRAILAARGSEKADLVAQTEKLLVEALPQKWLDADEIAQEMGLSRRTLSRRLADLGENFRGVSESLRQNLAETYLKDRSFSLAEIAFLLSFSDQSGFTSAFKRWTGQTPGSYRETHIKA